MPELYFATTNSGKVQSLQRVLADHGITVVQTAIDIPEPRSDDVREIAVAKVKYAFQQLNKPVVALDAGFYIPSLNGFPRAYVNFALNTIGLDGILCLVHEKEKSCTFKNCLAYFNGREVRQFVSDVSGTITHEIRGIQKKEQWSPLWQIFIPEHCTKTLAEMSAEEYEDWRKNHRDKESCFTQFVEWYKKTIFQSS